MNPGLIDRINDEINSGRGHGVYRYVDFIEVHTRPLVEGAPAPEYQVYIHPVKTRMFKAIITGFSAEGVSVDFKLPAGSDVMIVEGRNGAIGEVDIDDNGYMHLRM